MLSHFLQVFLPVDLGSTTAATSVGCSTSSTISDDIVLLLSVITTVMIIPSYYFSDLAYY